MNKKIPCIIDCDPGIDDAFSLLMAIANEKLNILGVTTVAGNMPVTTTTRNALDIIDLAGSKIPVAKGAVEAYCKEQIPHSELFHGKNGLGNVVIKTSHEKAHEKHAVEFMRTLLLESSEKIEIIALGPLTNIALLLKMYPEVIGQIKHLTIMGGGKDGGNITELAEFNFYCDAEAAKVVFQSKIPMTLVDLQGCESSRLYKEDISEILQYPSIVSDAVSKLWDFNNTLAKKIGEEGFVVHDAIAIASVIEHDIIKRETAQINIVVEDSLAYGQSKVKLVESSHIDISMATNKKAFINMCKETMAFYLRL